MDGKVLTEDITTRGILARPTEQFKDKVRGSLRGTSYKPRDLK